MLVTGFAVSDSFNRSNLKFSEKRARRRNATRFFIFDHLSNSAKCSILRIRRIKIMEWIFWIFLGLFAISLISSAITAYRYRKQIQAAWMMYRAFRQMKQKSKPTARDIPEKAAASDSPLVRCSKCQKWTPQDSAVKLKSNYFCSHSCMEKSFAN